jgi:hypothetical protein
MPNEISADDRPENFLVSDRIHETLAEPEMILNGLWPARTIGLFTGDGGVGKTHLTLQLLMLIASGGEMTGTPFQCSNPRDVVYISQEDEGDFLLGELRTQFPELRDNEEISSRMRIISTALHGPHLSLSDRQRCQFISESLTEGCVFGLDSWSTFLTSSENDNTELLRTEIAGLRSIMKARKATPLLIHHRPKPNAFGAQSSFRGGTALPNSCRFQIMVESSGTGVKLSFEKVSRGAKPDSLTLIFDEERRLFVPKDADRYVAVFEGGKELTTSEFVERIGKDPTNEKERKQALDILRYREGTIEKIKEAKKGEEAVWKRVS